MQEHEEGNIPVYESIIPELYDDMSEEEHERIHLNIFKDAGVVPARKRTRGRRGGKNKRTKGVLAILMTIPKRPKKCQRPVVEEEVEQHSEKEDLEPYKGDGEEIITSFAQLEGNELQRLTLVAALICNENWIVVDNLLLSWKKEMEVKFYSLVLYLLLYFQHDSVAKDLLSSLTRLQQKYCLQTVALLICNDQWKRAQSFHNVFEENLTWEQCIPGIYNQVNSLRVQIDSLASTYIDKNLVKQSNISFLAHTFILLRYSNISTLVIQLLPKKKREYIRPLVDWQTAEDWFQIQQTIEPIHDKQQKNIGLLFLIFVGENIQQRAQIQQWLTSLPLTVEDMPLDIFGLLYTSPRSYLFMPLLSAIISSPYFNNLEQVSEQAQEGESLLPSMPAINLQAELKTPLERLHELLFEIDILSDEEKVSQAQKIIKSLDDERERLQAVARLGEYFLELQWWSRAQQHFQRFTSSMFGPESSYTPVSFLDVSTWDRNEQRIKNILDLQNRSDTLEEFISLAFTTQQWERAVRVSMAIPVNRRREKALRQAKEIFVQNNLWNFALKSVQGMHDVIHRDRFLRILSNRLALEQQWELAQQVIEMIRDRRQKTRAIQKLGIELSKAHQQERLVHLIKQAWGKAETREEVLELFLLIQDLLPTYERIIQEFREAFDWTEDFLQN